jgi:hypothetical protein
VPRVDLVELVKHLPQGGAHGLAEGDELAAGADMAEHIVVEVLGYVEADLGRGTTLGYSPRNTRVI